MQAKPNIRNVFNKGSRKKNLLLIARPLRGAGGGGKGPCH